MGSASLSAGLLECDAFVLRAASRIYTVGHSGGKNFGANVRGPAASGQHQLLVQIAHHVDSVGMRACPCETTLCDQTWC